MKKETFNFSYSEPYMDWFITKNVSLEEDTYYYYKIEKRFGDSWWLIGTNPVEKPKYHWDETQIGRLSESDLKRFIKWASNDSGSKIIEVMAICGSFNIIDEITKIYNDIK